MNTADPQFAEETRTFAESLLTKHFSSSIQLDEPEELRGSNRAKVYRCSLTGPAHVPVSVILKRAYVKPPDHYNPDSSNILAWTLANEWASLQFLQECVPDFSFAPKLYTGDRALGLIVMEDLGSGKRLDQLLLGNDPVAAEQALLDHARVHGLLHAQTLGKHEAYRRIRKQLGPIASASPHYQIDWLDTVLDKTTQALVLTPEPGVAEELLLLKKSMEQPGPFLAFVQSDGCPDNCLYINDSLYLLDFEGGRFDHALKEGVYGRVPFPTCWCVYRLPVYIQLRMEELYRAELVKACPEAADNTLFYQAIVEASTFWMLELFEYFPLSALLENDRVLITLTVRQRLLMRIEPLLRLIDQVGHLRAVGLTLRAIYEKLSILWPESAEIPYYPAFR